MSGQSTPRLGRGGLGASASPHLTAQSRASLSEAEVKTGLLDLPPEILAEIASLLSLTDALAFLSTSRSTLSLTRSNVTPIRPLIRSLLAQSSYPQTLAVLPQLTSFVPRDGGAIFIDLLVRARPKWIIERLECGRWSEAVWKEAFERRFLPSWKKYKREGDTWRAVFMRTLGKLEHRYSGCTHEESWTRFVTLHRNGSGSLNRMYSRTFDPNDIYDEIKHQNNNDMYATQVRVIVHLQDVRIIALGVLADRSTFFVNPNAHRVLHPPLLSSVRIVRHSHEYEYGIDPPWTGYEVGQEAVEAIPRANETRSSGPLPIPVSPDHEAHQLSCSQQPVTPESRLSTSLRSTFSSFLPGRNRRTSSASDTGTTLAWGAELDRSISAEARRRSWSLSRTRSGGFTRPTQVDTIPIPAMAPSSSVGSPLSPRAQLAPSPLPPLLEDNASPDQSTLASSSSRTNTSTPQPRSISSPTLASWPTPYPTLIHPTPARSHRLYPNFTPPTSVEATNQPSHSASRGAPPTARRQERKRVDGRAAFAEVEDTDATSTEPVGLYGADRYGYACAPGRVGRPEDGLWGGGDAMAEWDEETQQRRRWVGSMIIVAQLHPSDRTEAAPAGSSLEGPIEGVGVDLGPKGMYTSLDWEDVAAILPWVHLKSSGAHSNDPRRSGMGFD